ncbi:hypothetical protein SELMODRAFT_423923 [Selaginella moellendorffii]|uniref:Putative F-box GID2 protein n=2 Tax=Selaginella moellendorffii TaxID=88036 RepID=A9LY18_SELML|nr:putative F-box GID2 protein [Selaginella moellendorffii]EFJ13111.1 hypothetical protein SELMODRAFT_123129 [Selaginella moellendorffii]EFJ14126.1 hypothetical protein SELMODRAFT_423923 [Selaginella moellendorffii]
MSQPPTVISQVERDDDMFYEILKHLDAKALAMAACVNRRWRRAAEDETLWENVCTINWSSASGASSQASQLRSVVLALGGFRRLYVLCLRPLLSRSSSVPAKASVQQQEKWSKDEVHLSLSLFSIDCYERLGRRYSNCHGSPLKLLCKSSRKADQRYLVPNAAAALELSGVN